MTTDAAPKPVPTQVVKRSTKSTRVRRKAKQTSANILGKITEVMRSGCSKQDFYRTTFRLIAAHFRASYGMLNVRIGPQTLQDEYQSDNRSPEDVMAVVDAMIIEAEAEERANVRLFSKEKGHNIAVLSAPIYAGAGQIGSFCLATTVKANKESRLLLSELIAILAFVGAQQMTDEKAAKTDSKTTGINRALEKASKYESINELAYSMVNNIAAKFNCDQVAFGLEKQQKVRLVAISGLDRFSRSSHGVTQIQQAMEECVDAHEAIHYQLSGGFGESSGEQSFLLHRQWHTASNNSSLLSVPMIMPDDQVTAVVSLQRSAERAFTQTEIERIRTMLQPFAAVVKLLDKASRSPLRQLQESAANLYQSILEPNQLARKIGAGALVAAGLFFVLGWMPHRVVVPCHVEPAAINHVTAPFQGTLRSVSVKDGDHVKAGQAIAKLDARPMELERDRLLSEIATYRIEMDRALANRSPAEAAIAQTSVNAAETQLGIIEARIKSSVIVAPVDGVVLKGELDQRIGQLVTFGDPLLEIGAEDGLHVQLHVPEDQARFVDAGYQGSFAGFARPGQPIEFELVRVAPSSVVLDEKNVFVADARLASTPDWMRVGMEGTAKVQAGWRPTWWVLTHGMIDKLRMSLWW